MTKLEKLQKEKEPRKNKSWQKNKQTIYLRRKHKTIKQIRRNNKRKTNYEIKEKQTKIVFLTKCRQRTRNTSMILVLLN